MTGPAEQWRAVAALSEPRRREVYDYVAGREQPATRDETAAALGMTRALAAFHLDKLADVGLLVVSFARPPGRGGPGAGRPTKRYTAGPARVELSLPARRDDLAARILARAVGRSRDPNRGAARAVARVARAEGEAVGRTYASGRRLSTTRTLGTTMKALTELGYRPSQPDDDTVLIRNCPFQGLVPSAPELVCGLNQSFVAGLLRGIGGARSVKAELSYPPEHCCVAVRAKH